MSNHSGFQTEIEFVLPKGFVDATGILHRHGRMRLATAADEILPQRDPRVQQNPAYLAVIVLARVVVRLGDLPDVDTRIIESLFTVDFDHLQRLYERINAADGDFAATGPFDGASAVPPAPARLNGHDAPAWGMRTMGEA